MRVFLKVFPVVEKSITQFDITNIKQIPISFSMDNLFGPKIQCNNVFMNDFSLSVSFTQALPPTFGIVLCLQTLTSVVSIVSICQVSKEDKAKVPYEKMSSSTHHISFQIILVKL